MEVFEASQTFLAIRGPLDSFVILPQDTSPCYITFVPTYSSSQRPCINISYIFNWQQDFKFHFWKLTVPVFCMTICYFTYYLTGFFFLLLFIVSLINLRWVTPIWDTRKKKKIAGHPAGVTLYWGSHSDSAAGHGRQRGRVQASPKRQFCTHL